MLEDPIANVLLTELERESSRLPAADNGVESAVMLPDGKEFASHLCELTRDIKFRIGPVEFASSEQSAKASEAFMGVADRMDIACESGMFPEECRTWAQNIRDRARLLRE